MERQPMPLVTSQALRNKLFERFHFAPLLLEKPMEADVVGTARLLHSHFGVDNGRSR
jgi:hypothetical protein